ncbi:hypothetical protein Btru_007554 [Bulinus truncatus]|nr:hypothetical protein Btru_007554 [Bulinus truncatus]
MALAWNLPVIIPRGNDENIRNLSIFPNIVALHPLDKVEVARFLMIICKKYNWKRVTLFVDSSLTVMSTTADVVQLFCVKYEMTCFQHQWSCFRCPDTDIDTDLIQAKSNSRVYILLMNIDDVRRLLIRATGLSMTQPEYLYIVPDIEGFEHTGLNVWQKNNSEDSLAKEAFRRVMLVLIKTPSQDSFSEMLLRLNRLMFDNDTSSYVTATYNDEELEGGDRFDTSAQQYILNGYYNCFLVYLTAVNDTLAQGGDIRDGQTFIRKIFNRTYLAGDRGEFQISAEGNRVVDMAVADMVDEASGTFQIIGDYVVLTRNFSLKPNYEKGWPSGGMYILNIPTCGFLGELCNSETFSLQLAMGLTFVIILCILTITSAVILRLRHVQKIKNLNWWRVQPDELQPVKLPNSRSIFSGSTNQNASTMTDVSITGRDYSLYQGTLVHMHLLTNNNIRVNASLLKEFQLVSMTSECLIRDMSHPNLLRILGACLEGEKKMLITEYCPKGTLQALIYIHKHPLRVHGRLTSEVCMIDSRFSVKVGYYGLPTIYESVKLRSKTQRQENGKMVAYVMDIT